MPMKCSIKCCKNYYSSSSGIHLFRFPKENDTLNKWIHLCNLQDTNFNFHQGRVCSSHFLNSDYENWLEFQTVKTKLRLKKGAVPSVGLPPEEFRSVIELEPEVLSVIKSEPEVLSVIKLEPEVLCCETSLEIANLRNEIEILKNREAHFKNQDRLIRLREARLSKENALLINRISCLESENKSLVKKNKSLEVEKLEVIEKSEIRKNIQSTQLQKQFDEILSKYFTPTQVEVIKNVKSRVTWSEQDIVIAFTLRYISKRCYLFMRKVLHYPLPCLSTLQAWAAKVSLKCGLFNEIIQMISIAAKKMTITDKLVVLQFDEMKVAEKDEYDVERDTISGPHRYMQVVQVCSLFAKWKQPIFTKFDQKMTKELLLEIISELYIKAGITVVACVSDCGSTKQGLWTSLGVSINNSSIQHPNCDDKIYFFADAPHLLKLMRNWLLDHGFEWDGKYITKEPLSILLNDRKSEVSSTFKCTKLHLECKGAMRQRVRLASELLSHSASKALICYKPPQETENQTNRREILSKFIEITNDWFDVMNSHIENGSTPLKSAYGKSYYIQEQNQALHKMYNMIENVRCIGKKNLQVFQTATLMSINSLKHLFLDMKNKYKMKFILTHKVNQDALENLFSQLRLRGGSNDHPTPSDMLNRMKLLILGKSDHTDEEYIVGKLIKSLPRKKKKQNISSDDSAVPSTSKNSDKETRVSENTENSSLQKEKRKPNELIHNNVGVRDADLNHSKDTDNSIVGFISNQSNKDTYAIENSQNTSPPIEKIKHTSVCVPIDNASITNANLNHSKDDSIVACTSKRSYNGTYSTENSQNLSSLIKKRKSKSDFENDSVVNFISKQSDNSTCAIENSEDSSPSIKKIKS